MSKLKTCISFTNHHHESKPIVKGKRIIRSMRLAMTGKKLVCAKIDDHKQDIYLLT